MTPDVPNLPGLVTALLLPWILGATWMSVITRQWPRSHPLFTVGGGYLLGVLLLTLCIRLWAAANLPLVFSGLSALLIALTVAGLALRRALPHTSIPAQRDPPPGVALTLLALGLGTLVAWRYATLGQELMLRPLFAWDAWMNWAPKAIVWFHAGELREFVPWESWLAQEPGGDAYTLGNRKAWGDPITVPLIQLWSMLGAGTWDHPALYSPWLFLPLAMGCSCYAGLRILAVDRAVAMIASYLLLSLPYINVHSVLAGYADLWLAATFLVAAFSLQHWQLYHKRSSLLLCIFMAFMCAQLKTPGLALMAIIGLGIARAVLTPTPRQELLICIVLVTVGLLTLWIGVELHIPGVGLVGLGLDAIGVPRLGTIELGFHNVSIPLLQALFVAPNWNLLACMLVLLVLGGITRRINPAPAPALLFCTVLAWLFLLGVFFCTEYYRAAENFVTVNRALLYVMPLNLFYLAAAIHSRLLRGRSFREKSA